MRRLILDIIAARLRRLADGLRLALLTLRYIAADHELQLLNTQAQRMAAERAELCERRGRIALRLLQLRSEQ